MKLGPLALTVMVWGCSAGDDTLEGSAGACSKGGIFEPCDEAARTPAGACSRLVECGAIPLERPETYQFDYDNCVSFIERSSTGSQTLIAACIAESKCDALLPKNPHDPNPNEIPCLHFGAE
ncbi:MAG TPA: hypothetical protein VLB44_17415 [Kofleriaceae bacterium]|nr:hypothetical protein [Kofleriaceae bacterium]